MATIIRFLAVASIKILSRCLYAFTIEWVGNRPPDDFEHARTGVFLNHTSLFEPLVLGALPFSVVWRFAKVGVIPGADITLNRPIAGRFYRLISRDMVPITRKRDSSWQEFLSRITPNSLVLIAPEGRMKRRNGLDKEGKPMTVRAGIADVLTILKSGKMILTYSGGLHHIHAPGDRFPRFFKRIKVRFESVEIADYLEAMGIDGDPKEFRRNVVADLEARRDKYCKF